jgi:uncharacterized protein (DUF2147 family)
MRAFLFAAGLALAAAPALAADPVQGEWLVQSGKARVRIAPCADRADRLCGLVSWLKAPLGDDGRPVRDANNPDPSLRTRPVIGLPLIRDFRNAGAGRWTGGRIYDPETGKSYNSKLRLNPDGTLKVEGCILVVCQAQTWRRAG